jgi:hypothetical protein
MGRRASEPLPRVLPAQRERHDRYKVEIQRLENAAAVIGKEATGSEMALRANAGRERLHGCILILAYGSWYAIECVQRASGHAQTNSPPLNLVTTM